MLVVLLVVALYVCSVSLLLFASSHKSIPHWVGPVDVAVALILIGVSAWIYTLASRMVDGPAIRSSYTVATWLPAVALMAMWFYADRLIWNILLPGLAWRAWLLFYTLPRALAIVRVNRGRDAMPELSR